MSNSRYNFKLQPEVVTIWPSYDKKRSAKYNDVKPYAVDDKCESCEKPRFAKQRFEKNRTTGFMTFIPPEEGSTCKSCNQDKNTNVIDKL